jgi:probable rRNA maturation factor
MINQQIAGSITTPIDNASLERAAQHTLQFTAAPAGIDLTIVLTDDAELQRLNYQFLELDTPTDVLAFPAGDIDPDTDTPYLGDVVISIPRAQAQADAEGHPLHDELQLLVVHGVLHLLGYDHIEEHDKAHMWAAQAEILTQLGCTMTLQSPPDA